MALTSTLPATASQSTLLQRLQVAQEHARRLTALYGTDSRDVAIAWETVEELTTAHRRLAARPSSAFSQYCAAHPDALECRIYED